MTLGGALIADMFQVEERGGAMSMWAVGPLFGPSIGPIIGAYVAESIGWHFDGWIVLGPATLVTIFTAIVTPETNHRVLIQRKVDSLRNQLGRPNLRSCYEESTLPRKTLIKQGLVRPLRLLFFSPVVFIPAVYVAFLYGSTYIMYNTIPMVFTQQYGWSTGTTGLVYIAIAFGDGVGLILFALLSDRTVVRMAKANGGIAEPEMRLPTVVYYAVILIAAFFWYGWSAQAQMHYMMPVTGLALFGLGMMGIWGPLQTYMVDAYPVYAASSLAGFAVLRSIAGTFLPFAGPAMFEQDKLGLGWGNSVLGFISLALLPLPIFLSRWGKQIRAKDPLEGQ